MTATFPFFNVAKRPLLVACCALLLASSAAETFALSNVALVEGPAQQIRLDGKTLYVAANRTLRIVDVGEPSEPKLVGTFAFAEPITAFVAASGLVYALTDFFGLRILDVSNPSNPVLRGALALKGSVTAAVFLGPKTIVTTNTVSGVQVLDVSDSAKPASVSSYYTDGYTQDVFASPPLAYVLDQPTGLHVLDFSKPASPAEISVADLHLPLPPGGLGVVDFPASRFVLLDQPAGTSSRVAAVLDRTSGFLGFYDLSNPKTPVKVSSVQAPPRSNTVKALGTKVYVAAGAAGLLIVDASDPKQPATVETFKMPQAARDVEVSGPFVFVATGAGGVAVLRQ